LLTDSDSVTAACVAGGVGEADAAVVRSIAAPGCAAPAIPPALVERPRKDQPDDCAQKRRAEDGDQSPGSALLCSEVLVEEPKG
jgi:hypothetical protein